MTNDERQITPPQPDNLERTNSLEGATSLGTGGLSPQIGLLFLIFATGLGAVGGGMAGVALGRSLSGKTGAAIGGVAGAIVGGVAGNKLAELAEEFTEELQPEIGLGLGANDKPIELPPHYSWEELQALSKNHTVEKVNQAAIRSLS